MEVLIGYLNDYLSTVLRKVTHMSSIRETTQKIVREFDDESNFIILLAAAMIPYLEEPINRARFFDYNKKLELYFDPKDINRFTRVKELTNIIAVKVNGKVIGFEKQLTNCRMRGLMAREKEGPSDGMTWQGFGGVHSHYNLTELGKAILIFQTSLRCSVVDLKRIETNDNWDAVIEKIIDLIIESIVQKQLKIRNRENHFYTKREATSIIIQLIFEFISGSPKGVTEEQIRKYIWDKAGEIHIGEIPESLEKLKPLLNYSGNSYTLNERGKFARIGYATVLVEVALTFDDSEIAHYMITAKNLEEGAKNMLMQYALWF